MLGTWNDTKVLGCEIGWIAFDADLANTDGEADKLLLSSHNVSSKSSF